MPREPSVRYFMDAFLTQSRGGAERQKSHAIAKRAARLRMAWIARIQPTSLSYLCVSAPRR